MDLEGPLPRTKAGNRYIVTMVNYGTRFPEAIPLRRTDSRTITDTMMEVFSRVGIPIEILVAKT